VKQFMIDMMAAMMPFMKTPVLIGFVVLALGIAALVWTLIKGKAPYLMQAGWILAILGGFYLICSGLGIYLGMKPTINFGDAAKFEFKTVEFWKIGLGFLIPGLLMIFTAKRRA